MRERERTIYPGKHHYFKLLKEYKLTAQKKKNVGILYVLSQQTF